MQHFFIERPTCYPSDLVKIADSLFVLEKRLSNISDDSAQNQQELKAITKAMLGHHQYLSGFHHFGYSKIRLLIVAAILLITFEKTKEETKMPLDIILSLFMALFTLNITYKTLIHPSFPGHIKLLEDTCNHYNQLVTQNKALKRENMHIFKITHITRITAEWSLFNLKLSNFKVVPLSEVEGRVLDNANKPTFRKFSIT